MQFVYATPNPNPAADDAACTIQNAVPIDQPDQVHQVTPALFACYEVDGGTVSLDGCLLEDVPFVRIEFRRMSSAGRATSSTIPATSPAKPSTAEPRIDGLLLSASSSSSSSPSSGSGARAAAFDGVEGWVVLDREGRVVEAHRAHAMGLDYPMSVESPPTYVNPADVKAWLFPLLERTDVELRKREYQIQGCTVVWCKRAVGRLSVEIGDESATIPFSGWARELAVGRTVPPPFRCPRTGRESYRITAAEEGQLTVPEAIKQCAASGRRVIETELETCAASGRQYLPEYLQPCEATGKLVAKQRLVRCGGCGQRVSPKAMNGDRCESCDRLGDRPATTAEVDQLWQRFPGLKKWRSWQHASSSSSELWRGYAWLKSILVRLDRETQRPSFVALANRMGKQVQEIDPSEWTEWLGVDVNDIDADALSGRR